jgi:threonine/homoserine/homoserine lactone efflux protein
MFGTHNLLIFLVACIALNLVPGQDTLYILGRSISQGRVAGVVSVLGVGSGCMIHIVAAAIGFYSLLALSPVAFMAICTAGGLYLIYLGIMTVVGTNTARSDFAHRYAREPVWVIYRQGVLTNLLNPKVALFFLAFLPQFIDPVPNPGSLSFLFLGAVFLCTGTIWCMTVALSASAIADQYRDNRKIQRYFEYFTCILFVALGIGILLGHI